MTQNEPPTLKKAYSLIDSLRSRVDRLEKSIQALKNTLNVKDNWASVTRGLLSHPVTVQDTNNVQTSGILKWTDWSHICVVVDGEEVIFSKNNVVCVIADRRLSDGETPKGNK